MAEYAVECVDRDTGNPYMVRVDAETHQQAIDKASKQHVAGRAHRVDFSSARAPTPHAARTAEEERELLVEQIRLLQSIDTRLNWLYLQERSAFTHIARAIAYSIVWLIVAGVAALVLPPFLAGMGLR